MNGATEQTLAELLATANAMNLNMVKLLKLADEIRKNGIASNNSGASGAAGAAAGLVSIAKAANPLSLALNAITKAGDAVGAVFTGLGKIVGYTIGVVSNVAGELVSFSIKAAEGKAKLSDLYAAFKDLPLGIGTVAGVFAKIVQYAEGLLDSYQKMTSAGASFSGDLLAMRNSAARAQLTLAELSSIVNKNSEFFSSMGGNVQKGIDKFLMTQELLMAPGSPYAKSILNLGVTAEETSQFLISMMKSQGVLGKQGAADSATLAKYTAEYITELDELSKITGKRREQIDAEVQKAEQDDAYQLFMDSLTPNEAAKAKTLLAIAETYNGKAGVEQMKLSLRGIDAPIGKLAEGLAVASGGISTNGEQYRRILRDSSISIEQASKATTKGQLDIAAGVGKFTKDLGIETLAAGAGVEYLNSASVATARKLDAAGGSQEKMAEMAKKQQAEQAKGSAAQLIQAQQNIKVFGNAITEMITRFLGPLASSLVTFGNSIMESVVVLISSSGFKKAVENITTWFKTTYNELVQAYSDGGIKSLMLKLGERLADGAKNVWEVVGPPLKAGFSYIWDEVRPKLIEGFVKLIDFIKPYFREIGLTIKETFEDVLSNKTGSMFFNKTEWEELNKRTVTDQRMKQDADFQAWLKKNQDVALSTGSAAMLDRYFNTRMNRDALVEEYKNYNNPGSRSGYTTGNIKPPEARTLGTLGILGQTSEPTDTTVSIEKGERVLNPVETASYNNQASAINQLNNLTAQLLQAQREANELSRRQLDAVKQLDGNLFA